MENGSSNSAGWLTTFNDLVTLLMVFFVLLFTMSTIDVKKMEDFQYALQSGLGIVETGRNVSIGVKETQMVDDMSHINTQSEATPNKQVEGKQIRELIEKIQQSIAPDLDVQVTHSSQGIWFTFDDQLLFDFGKAAINPAGFIFLDTIADVIDKTHYPVRVEGHTDNIPIQTRSFPSNWELSVARAVNVVKYFIEVSGINPQRFSAVGYGESRPVAANDTPADRAKNRRVEILLLTEGKEENVK